MLKVRYTIEDASRTDLDVLKTAFSTALNAGADRICFPDTVGILEPREIYERIQFIQQELCTDHLEVHLHDDRGLAMANALSAIEAGANWFPLQSMVLVSVAASQIHARYLQILHIIK